MRTVLIGATAFREWLSQKHTLNLAFSDFTFLALSPDQSVPLQPFVRAPRSGIVPTPLPPFEAYAGLALEKRLHPPAPLDTFVIGSYGRFGRLTVRAISAAN